MRTFIITVETEKDLPELVDTIANRIYVIAGVKDVEVVEVLSDEVKEPGSQYGY